MEEVAIGSRGRTALFVLLHRIFLKLRSVINNVGYTCSMCGRDKKFIKFFIGKFDEKRRLLDRRELRWEEVRVVGAGRTKQEDSLVSTGALRQWRS
jgi:hypothetical protein